MGGLTTDTHNTSGPKVQPDSTESSTWYCINQAESYSSRDRASQCLAGRDGNSRGNGSCSQVENPPTKGAIPMSKMVCRPVHLRTTVCGELTESPGWR